MSNAIRTCQKLFSPNYNQKTNQRVHISQNMDAPQKEKGCKTIKIIKNRVDRAIRDYKKQLNGSKIDYLNLEIDRT